MPEIDSPTIEEDIILEGNSQQDSEKDLINHEQDLGKYILLGLEGAGKTTLLNWMK